MGPQFRLFGIPVRVNPLFFVTAVAIGLPGQNEPQWFSRLLIWVAVVFGGVLVHELGHALMGRVYGLVPRIELYMLGGLTWWDSSAPLTPWRSISVSLAGPFVGIGVGIASWVVWGSAALGGGGLAAHTLQSLVWVNLGWGILNLIPMLPLDGGNVVASAFELFSRERGRRMAQWLSLGVAAALLLVAIRFQLIFAAFLVGLLGFNNWQALRTEKALQADKPLRDKLQRAYGALARDDTQELSQYAEEIVFSASTSAMRAEGQRLRAWSRFLKGDRAGAQKELDSLVTAGAEEHPLGAALLLQDGDEDGALRHLELALEDAGAADDERIAAVFRHTGRFDLATVLFESKAARRASPHTIHRVQQERGRLFQNSSSSSSDS
jgi:Zn-dependent protease